MPAASPASLIAPRLIGARAPRTVVFCGLAAALITAAGLLSTLAQGLDQPHAALAFGALIVFGELVAARPKATAHPEPIPAGHVVAPIASAGSLAYALLGECAGEATTHGALQVVAVVFSATLLGSVPHVARGRAFAVDHLIRRILTVTFAATLFQPLFNSGLLGSVTGRGPLYVLYLVTVLGLTYLCDASLAAALSRARTGWPYAPLLRDEVRALPGVPIARCATAAVTAMAAAVAGLWALPVFCLPLLLTQLSMRRFAAVRTTYRQTIASLARATEIAGYTPPGHARRVASLSRSVGREMGLAERDLDVLEQAALMHDIGQLSLLDPVPAGATEPLATVDQRRIARLGGAVVRQTGVDSAVAVIVERQAEPWREQPVAARIVRAANAYDDLARAADRSPGTAGNRFEGPLKALERLRLSTASDYDPRVVAALYRVLAHGAHASRVTDR
ncbi:HD domain-containing protein [Streptomyces sp. A7024]|uniref:HD domain-containing protein n=1 Tax=Streptomyces coryli TaxID=1128680 RepID=A0A6G4UBU0_9ACTN|nr:HD domain-containing protein [Streptomyces coryli]